jgi:hypothetical protein
MSTETDGHESPNGEPKRLITDFAQLNTADPAEQGTEIELEHPVTDDVLLGTDGKPMTWTLRGEDAPSVRKVEKKQQDKRNEKLNRGKGVSFDYDTNEANLTERLLAATIRFSDNFPPVDGKPCVYSPAMARALLTDGRFKWLEAQLTRALGDRKRFLTAGSTP